MYHTVGIHYEIFVLFVDVYDIQLWSVSDGGLVGVMRGHRRGIWSVQFSPVDQVRPFTYYYSFHKSCFVPH